MNLQYCQTIPGVQLALQQLAHWPPVVEEIIAVQQIAAPTFEEGARAAYVQARMEAVGLQSVQRDALHNVYGFHAGNGHGPTLLISAHLDTVFPNTTDLKVQRLGDRVYGPGIGDNSTGVAGLLRLAEVIAKHNLPHTGDIWFVANVGEEGLGDLRGMRAVVDRFNDQLDAVIVIEGCDFGTIYHQAIGVRRYRIAVETPGGHSWGDFGTPSAIHELVQLAAHLTTIPVPNEPRTTFNIGMIEGGTSVNTIAQHANLLLDMRSADINALQELIAHVDRIVWSARNRDVRINVTTVGDRPAGAIPRDHPIVQIVTAAYHTVGAPVSYHQGSTDANIPLSRGIPAVCIGLTDGGNAHRTDEYIEPATLGRGLQAALLMLLALTTPDPTSG